MLEHACLVVPEEVKKLMLGTVSMLQQNLIKKSMFGVDLESNVSDSENFRKKPSQEESVGGESSSIFKRRGSQSTINSIFKKSEREDTCQQIVLFFYNNAIPFNVARSEEFTKVVEMIAKHGLGIKPPSYHGIWVKYLKQQVEKTNQILEEHRLCWKKYGVQPRLNL